MLCLGVSSKAGRGKHIMMVDIDKCTLQQAISAATRLIVTFRLSDTYIIESSPGSYHLICLDKMDWKQLERIVNQYCDPQWIKYRKKANELVLRISKKKTMPKLKLCVKGKGRRRRSNAHRLLLNAIYGLNIENDYHFDGIGRVELHVYETERGFEHGRQVC